MIKFPDIKIIIKSFHAPRFKLSLVKKIKVKNLAFVLPSIVLIIFTLFLIQKSKESKSQAQNLENQKRELESKFETSQKSLTELQNNDQYLRNKTLEEEIKNTQETYKKAVSVYEDLLDLKDRSKDTSKLDEAFASSLSLLSQRNYTSAEAKLASLSKDIKSEMDKIAATFKIPENIPIESSAPASGYRRQKVQIDSGTFMVDIISADIGSTKVIVDTASDSDCGNNCPVLSLSDYVSRNSAYAGVNGTYFCPSTYPTCAGKTNSFDLLVMNKNKTYFNSSNNVYSNNPAVIFGDNYIRFVSAASQWGRDTSPNGVLSNYPLLVFNSNISFNGDEDPKHINKGGRSFVANKGSNIFIGVVHNATVAESAKAMKALGMENAMNLDDGGSVALWFSGYKVGPGRNIPNAILLVKK